MGPISTQHSVLRISALMAGLFVANAVAAQDPYWILAHPPPPPRPEDFRPPPTEAHKIWMGPFINQVGDASCWRVEPNAPQTPVGGAHGTQSVVGFVRLPTRALDNQDRGFRQTQVDGLAGGGMTSGLGPEDIPPGFLLAAKAHPVFKITKVEFHSSAKPIFSGPVLAVFADFLHEPTMGECYFYLAAWVAQKQ